MKKSTFFLVTLLGLSVSAGEIYHVVKKGETLSGILQSKKLGPIYGKRGSIRETLKLNSKLKITHGNKILPNMKLRLPGNISERQVASADTPVGAMSGENISSENSEKVESIVIEKDKIISRSDLAIAFSSRFIRVKSNDRTVGTNATFLSESGLGYKLIWGQLWSERLHTYLAHESFSVKISNLALIGKTLANQEQRFSSYEFGFDYKYSVNLKLTSTLSYGESLVVRAIDTTTINLEKFNSPKLSAGLSYVILSQGMLKLSTLADLIIALPSTQEPYSSQTSLGYKIGLGLEDKISIFKIKGELFYKDINYKMTRATFDQTEVGVIAGFTKELSEEN